MCPTNIGYAARRWVTVLCLATVLILIPQPQYAFSLFKPKSEQSKLVIPDFDSAREQYAYAASLQNGMLPSLDKTRRRQQLDRIIQAYSKVVQNFPDDKVYTPVAYVTIAESQAEMGKEDIAQGMFHDAMQRWAENDYIVARCMLDIASSLDRQKRFSESQKVYRDIIERFKDSQKPGIGDIVARAKARYYTTREEPVRKDKPSPLRSFFQRLNPFRK
jgi:hypothetical protein